MGKTLVNLQLGDLVGMPSGEMFTVRAVAELGVEIGPMAAFVLLGELELLLSVPSNPQRPLGVYLPVDPERVRRHQIRVAASGSIRFWAPHLPASSGAMGEALFEVLELKTSVEPAVVIERAPEKVAFIPSTTVFNGNLKVVRMSRQVDPEEPVLRHAATVDVSAVPASLFETVVTQPVR